VQPSSF